MSVEQQTPISPEGKQTPLSRRSFLGMASRVGMVAGASSMFGGLFGFIAELVTEYNASQSALDREAPRVDPTEFAQAEDIRDNFVESAATPAAQAAASGAKDIYVHADNPQGLSEAIAVIQRQSQRDDVAERLSAELLGERKTYPFIYLAGGGAFAMATGVALEIVAHPIGSKSLKSEVK